MLESLPPTLFRIHSMPFLGSGVIGVSDPQTLREDIHAWGRLGMDYYNQTPCLGFVIAAIVEDNIDGVESVIFCIYANGEVNSYKTTIAEFKQKLYGSWFDIQAIVPTFGVQQH